MQENKAVFDTQGNPAMQPAPEMPDSAPEQKKQMRPDKGYTDEPPLAPVHMAHVENPTVRAIVHQQPSNTDPSGSYTGKPVIPSEMPQQDADDL